MRICPAVFTAMTMLATLPAGAGRGMSIARGRPLHRGLTRGRDRHVTFQLKPLHSRFGRRLLLLFVVAGKQLVSGIMQGAVKG